jgi:hypothetical protein
MNRDSFSNQNPHIEYKLRKKNMRYKTVQWLINVNRLAKKIQIECAYLTLKIKLEQSFFVAHVAGVSAVQQVELEKQLNKNFRFNNFLFIF